MEIKIGIHTNGSPKLEFTNHQKHSDANGNEMYIPKTPDIRAILHNMLIGVGFHWEQTIKASLPGIIVKNNNSIINILDAEEYLKRVVGSEMNPNAPMEFLKVHAIVSRSWVYGKAQHTHPENKNGEVLSGQKIILWQDTADHRDFDVCSDDHCQRYQGDIDICTQAIEAIEETEGMVLADSEGKIADARFSKCCGGQTEIFSTCWQDIDFSYLKSVKCPHCNPKSMPAEKLKKLQHDCLKNYDSPTNDFYHWKQFVPSTLILENLKNFYNIKLSGIKNIQAINRGPSGRISLMRITGLKEDETIDIGKELTIRKLLSDTHLYSSAFDIQKDEGGFMLEGKGWGHGVGMCQIGAASMALDGSKAEDILNFYFPTTKLIKL